jgi:hypothetical protein
MADPRSDGKRVLPPPYNYKKLKRLNKVSSLV